MNNEININDLEFVDLKGEMKVPVGTTFTGFKPGQKILYLTKFGGQPDIRIITFKEEAINHKHGLIIYVEEFDGYIEPHQIYTQESINDMFDSYDEKEKRRRRAINDKIIPAIQLSNEEIDNIIDGNVEWCKVYEEKNKDKIPTEEPTKCCKCSRVMDDPEGWVEGLNNHMWCPACQPKKEGEVKTCTLTRRSDGTALANCSNCGGGQLYDYYRFCPNCGARNITYAKKIPVENRSRWCEDGL